MPTRDELGAALRKADAAAKAGDPKAADAARRFAMAIRDMDAQQTAPKPAPAMQMQPAPKPAPMPMQSGQPNISPMGGVGEFDPKAFAGLKLPQQQASTENPIIAEQRRQQDLAGRNFAAQQPGRMAKEQRWKDELAAMNAAGVIPFKNNGPDGPLELNQERPDQFFGRAAGSFVNSNIGVANLAGQVGLNTANAFGAAGDPSMQGALAGGEYGDITQRVADAATAGGYAQNQQKIDDIIPSLPIPAAQTAGEMGADVTGNLAAVFTGWGAPVLKGGQAFSETLAAVPGLSHTLRGVGVETGENAALAYGMGAGAAPPGSDRNMAGTQSAADPLNYVSIEALRALGRIPGQIDRALPATNAGAARPGPIDTAALEPRPPAAAPPAAAVTPNAPAATPAPAQPPVTAVPSFQRQPIPTAQAAGAPPIQPPPPAVAAANAPVPTPGAVPPAGNLVPIPQNEAVAAFNALPPKTREAMLRTLNSAGMDANGFWSDAWRKLTGRFRNSNEAMDAIRKLGDMPEDRQVMFALELMKNNGGDLETILPAMGRKWATEGARDPQLLGGTDRAREIMDANVPKVINSQGERVAGIAEENFGPGIVPAGEAIDVEKRALATQYDKLLNPQRSQYSTGGKGQVRAPQKRAGIDQAIASIKTYLKRPEVINEMPDWVKMKVVQRASEDMRNIGFTDAQKAVILAGDGAVLAPLFEASGPLTWSPKMWAHLVEQYPTQAAHILQSAYREAADGLMSGVSRTQADVTNAQYLMRLRGESGKGGLLDMLERAIPGEGGKVGGKGGYQWTRQNFGDNRSAERAFDILERFKTAANSEGDVAKIITELKDLPARHREAAENQITSLIRQELGRKVENVKLSELDNPDRLSAPNLTTLSNQNFLNALEDVFGERGKELADGIRLARASTDTLTSISPKYNSRTQVNAEDVQKAGARYEDPAGAEGGVIDKTVGGLASGGIVTGASAALGVSAAGGLTVPLLGLAAGKALYNAYKGGKRLSNTERNQLVDFLFRARKAGEGAPTPRRINNGNVIGSAAVNAVVGGTIGGLSSEGDPGAIAAGAGLGAGLGAGRQIVRSRSTIIKPPPARGPRRGPPPFGGNRVTGAGPAPQITPPGSPPVQNGFFGGGPKPPKPPVPKAPVAAKDLSAEHAASELAFENKASAIEKAGNFGDFTVSRGWKMPEGTLFEVRKGDNVVGTFVFEKRGWSDEYSIHADVNPEFQRQGVATAFYDHVENAIGQKLKPSGTQSPEGAAFTRSRQSPSSVTPLNAPKPPTRQGMGSSKLPMDEGARMARAREQGFDVDTPLYHGTASDVEAFDPSKFGSATNAQSAKLGVWLTSSPNTASGYAKLAAEDTPVSKILRLADEAERKGNFDEAASLQLAAEWKERDITNNGGRGANVMPVYVRGRIKSIDMEGAKYDPTDTPLTKMAEQAKKEGYDGLKLQNFSDEGGWGQYSPTDHVLIFDPSNIRGKFAKFDPAESSSSKLLAGLGGPSGAGAAGGGILGATLAPDANGDGTVDAQERANGFLGGAFSGGIAGKALGSRAAGKASGAQAQGFGAGRPKPPPNRLSGPPKPRPVEARRQAPRGNNPFSDPRLSPGENKTAEMIQNGYTYEEIADEMMTSLDVVKKQASNAQKKLGADVQLPRPGQGKRPPGSTKREAAFELFDSGANNAQIAERLGMSIGNVKTYRSYWREQSRASVASIEGAAYNPPAMPERPFEADYPQKDWPNGPPVDAQGRLTQDMDRKPLDPNSVVIGRNKAPGNGPRSEADRSLRDRIAIIQTLKQGGSRLEMEGRPKNKASGGWAPDFDANGRFTGRGSAKIADDLDRPITGLDDQEVIVLSHELAHSIDFKGAPSRNVGGFNDRKWGIDHTALAPEHKAELESQLERIYRDLNNPVDGEVKIRTPKDRGYEAIEADRELWAEAIRAYMYDPNYIKTVAPDVAFMIRDHVNRNSSLRKTIQFNAVPTIVGVGGLGLGAAALSSQPAEAQKR